MSTKASGLAVHRVAAAAMAERAVALLGERLAAGAQPHELAVLARVNSALLPVQVALTEAGIPHTAPLDATVLGRTGVRTALAYLRLGLDLERIRRDDIFDTINRPARKVKSAVQPLLPSGRTVSIRQLEALLPSLGETHRDRFRDYLLDLTRLEQSITDGADTATCLSIIRNRIGLGEAMDALDASRSRPEGSSHGDDLDALEQLAALQPDPAAFRDWLVERLKVPGDPTGVTLSSVHRVKGMEWPHVIVFAANQGLFPHRLADDVEEERRVFHVAVTRCQQQVDVIADQDRTAPFVAELTAASDHVVTARAGEALPEPRAATRRDDGAVVASTGVLVTVVGGFTGAITAVTRDHAVVTLSPDGQPAGSGASGTAGGHAVALRVPFGQRVTVDGRPGLLVRAPSRRGAGTGPGLAGAGTAGAGTGGGTSGGRAGRLLELDDDTPIDEALYEALRAWRSRKAAEAQMPAYIIFNDRHLQFMAGRKPGTLRELAGCPGVGPTKLERYGDDLLDLIAEHPA